MNTNDESSYEYRVLCALRRVIRAVDIYSRKLNSEFGLTTPQLLCLDNLARMEKTTVKLLTNTVNLSGSTVIGILDRLEIKGYLIRNRSKEDRRKVYLEITATGKEVVSKAPSLLQDKLSGSLLELPEPEQKTITESLERIVEMMQAEKIDASPNLMPPADIEMKNKK